VIERADAGGGGGEQCAAAGDEEIVEAGGLAAPAAVPRLLGVRDVASARCCGVSRVLVDALSAFGSTAAPAAAVLEAAAGCGASRSSWSSKGASAAAEKTLVRDFAVYSRTCRLVLRLEQQGSSLAAAEIDLSASRLLPVVAVGALLLDAVMPTAKLVSVPSRFFPLLQLSRLNLRDLPHRNTYTRISNAHSAATTLNNVHNVKRAAPSQATVTRAVGRSRKHRLAIRTPTLHPVVVNVRKVRNAGNG